MSSVRKICLRFDRVQRKSDPYHLAYFLLTSIEKNYQEVDIHFCTVITCSFQLAFDGFLNSINKYLSIIEDNIQREEAGF